MAYDGGVEGWRGRGLERNLRTQRTGPVSAHRKQGSPGPSGLCLRAPGQGVGVRVRGSREVSS